MVDDREKPVMEVGVVCVCVEKLKVENGIEREKL